MRKVAVIGIGMTRFKSHWNKDIIDLALEAGVKAIQDAGIHQKDVQALYGGTMSGGLFSNQEHLSSMLSDQMGFKNIPATRVEAACASGGVAFRQGYLDVISGMHDLVVVGGVEKMTNVKANEVTRVLSTASDYERESLLGATFPSIYAMIAKRHMHSFGTTEEQMAEVSVKNHSNAISNEFAQFKKRISVDDVMNSMKISDPIKLLDSSPVTDGAAAVVIASEDKARQLCDSPVWISGSGHATDSVSLHDRESITTLKATVQASKQAYIQSKMNAKQIEVAEVHDCFTISEIISIEDLGFIKKGKGGNFTEEGNTCIGGSIPINTSGGLKAKGHPVGATGIAQVIEATLQLRGEAGKRQVEAETALTHNIGGSGGTAVVHIFKR